MGPGLDAPELSKPGAVEISMRIVIVGPGAVGAVVGTLLANDGHEVAFWVRPERREHAALLSVERVSGTTVRAERVKWLTHGDAVPPSDWVLVCVRGEQLDAALGEIGSQMGCDRRIAIAAVSLESVSEQARRAGLTGPIFALHASFGSHQSPIREHHYLWHPFRLPTTVTPDGRRADLPHARGLARALAHAGLPARARRSMTNAMRFLVAENSVLALGWDMCGWDIGRLAGHPTLRPTTARAMHEAARLVLPERSPMRGLPAITFDLFLRVLPWLMGGKARSMWHHHGPKIRGQTEDVVRKLVARAQGSRTPIPALTQLADYAISGSKGPP